jgi:DNA-binding MarR family transcriptional regulator
MSKKPFNSDDVRTKLLPLIFEMGRVLKSEAYKDDAEMPSYLHIETLRFIQESKDPSMSDIAGYLRVTRPTATSLINAFVIDGMLDRVDDAEDRRIVRLQLSNKGVVALEEAMKKRAEAFSRVIKLLSDDDCIELARILTIITHK